MLCQLSYDPVAVGLGKEQGSVSFLPDENYFVRSTGTQVDTRNLAISRTTLRPSKIVRRSGKLRLLRKEVIQPQVALRLPCYDFIPITTHTFGACLLAVSTATSGTSGFHDVTGGVYKAWERIHGAVADAPLLAIPASCRRVADDNLNWARFWGIGSTLQSCFPLYRAL